MEDKAALINFIGNVYGQMKEIDNHIAAAGSNAKFGNRSADIQNVLKEVVAAPTMPQPPKQHAALHMQPAPQASAEYTPMHPVKVHDLAPAQNQNAQQLELPFSSSEKSILSDIYNVLYDIKKLMIEFQKKQDTKPAKVKKYEKCCLCGSQPKLNKTQDSDFELKCTGCKNSETDDTVSLVKTKWNKANVQL